MWQMGQYMVSAICASLYPKANYIKEPFLQNKKLIENNKELTEEQKKMERDKLLMTLQLMQANFEMNHKKDENQNQDG